LILFRLPSNYQERQNVLELPRVSVITLNWNGKDDTIDCIASLQKLTYPNYDIVVVDNGSTDGSVSALRAQYPNITIIENGRNLGYAEGFNEGLRYAYASCADYLLILNNDTIVDPSVLTALIRVAETDRKIGFVSGKVYFQAQPNMLETVGRYNHPLLIAGQLVGLEEIDRGQYDQLKEYDFLDDVFLLVRRETFAETGGYDPNFFLYYEETDWCIRVRKAGYKLVYTPEAKIWHKHSRSSGGERSTTWMYYMTRNQIVFLRRNASNGAFARAMGHLAISGLNKVARCVKHRRFDMIGAYFRGLGSGLLWVLGYGRRPPVPISRRDSPVLSASR
jgi:GT2 family glycosyltransferase